MIAVFVVSANKAQVLQKTLKYTFIHFLAKIINCKHKYLYFHFKNQNAPTISNWPQNSSRHN